LSRSDRVAKYNRLMEIADELGRAAIYPGGTVFKAPLPHAAVHTAG
jgi:enolase